jgi:hypothetical protein
MQHSISFPIYNFELSHRNSISKCRTSRLFPRSSITLLSALILYAQPQKNTFHHRGKNLDSRSSKFVSHNVLELQRGRLPHGTPSYRKVGYVWNVVFGILYNDNQ